MKQEQIQKVMSPQGVIEAAFAGNDDRGLYIWVNEEIDLEREYFLALYNGKDIRCIMSQAKPEIDAFRRTVFCIPLSKLEEIEWDAEEWSICVGQTDHALGQMLFLRKAGLQLPNQCTEEMYDRRSLYGEAIFCPGNGKCVLPHYKTNGILAVDFVKREEEIYAKQLRNEILAVESAPEEDVSILFLKCKKIDGNYIGLFAGELTEVNSDLDNIVYYEAYEEDKNFSYMRFRMQRAKLTASYQIAWRYHGKIYFAPVAEKMERWPAEITEAEWQEKSKLKLVVQVDSTKYGAYESAQITPLTEEWERTEAIAVKEESMEEKQGLLEITYCLDTAVLLYRIGKWELNILTRNEENTETYPAVLGGQKETLKNSLLNQDIYDSADTKSKIVFSVIDNRFVLERKYGHNSLFKKNIQTDSLLSLQDFLDMDAIKPRGEMYAEFADDREGELKIRLFQAMENVIEAKLVMFHTQGLGVLATQTLDVTDGRVECFAVDSPDIDKNEKFLKPVNSVWFRIAIALRTPKGIYFNLLRQYDLNTETPADGNIYDCRRLYRRPIGSQSICQIEMTAVPYYASNQLLSMKFVRPEQLYRSQFTNELLDVQIKKDILIVKMRCRDCGGEYKGVLLEYRKEKEDDAETHLIPYTSLTEEGGSYYMVTRIDLKKYYLRMLYWDIRCAFEKDGIVYNVSCHSNNKRFLRKYKNIFVDRTYPNENSILFPYATSNDSVALMHRETCPQDHWRFRFKERIALKIYKAFQKYWDNKNIYLIFEKYCIMAQDNGYYFFKYCMDAKVENNFSGKLYYVLDAHAEDWNKILPYKSHVVKYLSLRHMIYLLACHLMISTDTKGHAYVWRSMGSDIKAMSYQKNLVFLQHGVTAFKRGHFERGTNVGCEYFITTSQHEHDIIRNYLGYTDEEIPITGFARWDVLQDKSQGHREILMMPTWRTWLDDAENEVFAQSEYCKNYMALLNNPKLDEILREYDVTLNFYLHPKFRKFITEFSVVSEHIRLIPFGEEPLNELMMQCNLLITDFSSVAWDVYYMDKPVLFYHFDIEDASKTLGFYMDMKNDLFGDRAESPGELMELIVEYIENDFRMKSEYKQDRQKYFAYIDNNNSERIWKAIRQRNW